MFAIDYKVDSLKKNFYARIVFTLYQSLFTLHESHQFINICFVPPTLQN